VHEDDRTAELSDSSSAYSCFDVSPIVRDKAVTFVFSGSETRILTHLVAENLMILKFKSCRIYSNIVERFDPTGGKYDPATGSEVGQFEYVIVS
jgi:hypothetical protein